MGHVPTLDAATLTPDQVSQSRYVLWAEEKWLRLLVGFIAELVLIAQMLFSFVFHVRLQIWGLSENRWLQNLINAYCHKTSKANHQDTARLCSAQGICFRPMVAETTGAWDKSAAHVLHIIAAAVAAREGATVAELHQRLLQELSVTARRFRAQAALRR